MTPLPWIARAATAVAASLALMLGSLGPAGAARPLLDQHQWDAYFALFARDSNVPWQTATIRLDTYSGAPVDFAAYDVDPAAVIIAGQNRPARALDTARLRPVARWRFTPPPGYRFISSDVGVPLGTREGFYVIEARRGDAVQQVWINRTHVGLVTSESPQGLVLWGVDLRTGHGIPKMHVDFLVGLTLVGKSTGPDGTIVWNEPKRPSFALAESGAGRAFVSMLPAAPLPETLVGLRLADGIVRAGGHLRLVGFARRLSTSGYRRGSGGVRVKLAGSGRTVAQATTRLDGAGAFDADLTVPAGTPAGSYAVLASAAGGVGGTSVQIDAAADVGLAAIADCPCDAARPVTILVTATAGLAATPAVGAAVRVQVIRIPHVLPPGAAGGVPPWGTTVVADRRTSTDASGLAKVTLLPPSDGLDSTYAVKATTAGASATARVVVPNAAVALALAPAAAEGDPGAPIGFTVRAFRVDDGTPVPGLAVRLRVTHGSTRRDASVVTDADGTKRLAIAHPSLGENLAVASATAPDGREILDAASVDVAPRALGGASASTDADLSIATDRTRYGPHDRVSVRASAPGAAGDAFVSIVGARTYALRVAGVAGGHAAATLDLGDAQGDVRALVAFVRNGAIATAEAPVNVEGPGRERTTELALDNNSYAPGSTLRATIRDGTGGASGAPSTIALRISDGLAEGPAAFSDAAEVLRTGGTTSQAPASDNVSWHAWIAPSHSKASDLFGTERGRRVATEAPDLGAAAPHTLLWSVGQKSGPTVEVDVPRRRGHYVLSVLKMQPSGEVGAASASFEVE